VAEGTVRGAFDLDVSQPIRGLREYRREAARADTQTAQLGGTIDRVFGPSTVAQFRAAREEMGGLAETSRTTRMTVRDEWKGMRREIQREAASIVSTIATVRDRMRALGRETMKPHIDVTGIAAALAQVELLTARLEALGAMRPTARVGIGGGISRAAAGAAAAGGGGGRAGGSGIVNLGGIGFAGIRGRSLLAAGGLALPAIQAVGGAGGALLGSAGSAALGAGATGLGGLAPLVAGIGAVMSVAKPANAALKDVWKAQDDYSKAVREHGKWSKEATEAQRELTRMQRVAGPGSGYAAGQARGFGRDWRRMSAPARQQYFGLLGDVAQVGRRVAPNLARNALTATTAVRQQGARQARFLAGDRMQDDLGFFTRTFARELPTAERTLENVERTMVNIARASTPFFHEANVWAREQTAGWRSSTTNIEETRRKMEPLVDSAKRWAHLTGTTFDLMRDIGRMGRPSGDSLVGSLDATFTRWDTWIESHPQETANFFRDTANSTREMASGLAGAVHYMNQLATALRPLLDRFSQLVSLASSLGLIGTPGAAAAIFGAVRGARGAGAAASGGGAGLVAGVGAGAAIAGARAGGVPRAGAGATRAGTLLYGSGFRSGAPVSQLGSRMSRGPLGRGAGRAMGAARGAGRAFAPIALGLGALDFASTPGTFTQRAQQALSSATLGLIPEALTGAGQAAAGVDEARRSAAGMGSARSAADLRRQIAELSRRRAGVVARTRPSSDTGLLGGRGALGLFDPGHGGDKGPTAEEQRKNVAKAAEYARVIKALREQEDALNRSRQRSLADLSARRGAAYGARLGSAYQVYRKAGLGRQEAAGRVVSQVQHRLAGTTQPEGVEALGESSLSWARAMAKGHPEMKKTVDELTRSITARFKKLGHDVQIVNGDILRGTRSEWRGIAAAMTTATEQARQKTRSDFTAIQRQAIGSLVAMGMSQSQARSTVQGLEAGSRQAQDTVKAYSSGNAPKTLKGSGLVGGGAPNARGGMIGGSGLMDTVPTPDGGTAAPGETWIANRHTMAKLGLATRAMYGLTAQQMIRGETRRHSAPAYARGGLAGGIGSLGRILIGQFPGLSVTSTTGGKHAAGSYHYRGMAEDIAGPPATMNAAARWVAVNYGKSLAEGIHNPGLSVKDGKTVPSSFWGAQTWRGHADHIHLAVIGAALAAGGLAGGGRAGGLAGGQIRVRGLGQRQPGVPGVIRGRAGDVYAAGLQRQVNAALGGGGTTAGAMGGSIAQMVAAAGLPAVFNAIIRAESGGNPNARNASGASGLTQIMMPLHQGLVARYGGNVFDPMTNLRVAKHLYDESGLSPWTASRGVWGKSLGRARGGRMKWAGAFDRGGSFTTDGPTAFVAGEGPRNRRERVTVTPAGSNTGGAQVHVTFAPGSIVIHAGKGGVDAKSIGEQVAGEILAALRNGATSAVIG